MTYIGNGVISVKSTPRSSVVTNHTHASAFGMRQQPSFLSEAIFQESRPHARPEPERDIMSAGRTYNAGSMPAPHDPTTTSPSRAPATVKDQWYDTMGMSRRHATPADRSRPASQNTAMKNTDLGVNLVSHMIDGSTCLGIPLWRCAELPLRVRHRLSW